jgi:transcription-repair coupling factor (superfamily II helicase)
MDRLVIGDVGYGKTEIALRAAAFVALTGGQAVLAAPTTVLVRQHYELFRARFEDAGVAVGMLSSSSTPAEKRAVLSGLAEGSIAVVIGTGAVAGKSVRYRQLQLVVIDEEQRFGAADKAKLRALHGGHFLALSATPIPRTLQNALVGLQQLSVIATPPARRQPIRTVVDNWDDSRVRAALLREQARRGQSFMVVPRIADMEAIKDKLRGLTPELTVVCAHGKLPAAELDIVMTEFAKGQGDVLLATNIIEAGLDVPRANTMIVWRADRFGLSQLHQLRGRVGRGNLRGQIMLLTEAGHPIGEATAKRLRTLEALDRLGAGFAISARDLDLRGGGDLLGDSQAGHMKLVGVELYQHMLESALRLARGEKADLPATDLRLGIHGRLPEDWIPDTDLRLQLYVRLARLTDLGALDAFGEELQDRFGSNPEDANVLFSVARVRVLAQTLGFARIDAGRAAIALNPRGTRLTASPHPSAKFVDGRLIVRERYSDAKTRLMRLEQILLEILD